MPPLDLGVELEESRVLSESEPPIDTATDGSDHDEIYPRLLGKVRLTDVAVVTDNHDEVTFGEIDSCRREADEFFGKRPRQDRSLPPSGGAEIEQESGPE